MLRCRRIRDLKSRSFEMDFRNSPGTERSRSDHAGTVTDASQESNPRLAYSTPIAETPSPFDDLEVRSWSLRLAIARAFVCPSSLKMNGGEGNQK